MEAQETQQIKKDMIIGDILAISPGKTHKMANILTDFGIHCVGCGAASFETLEEGVLAHGYSEQELNQLVEKLNKVLQEPTETPSFETKGEFRINFTEAAVKKLKEIIKSEAKGEILRISVLPGGCSGYTYDMEIIENSIEEDFTLEQNGLTLSIDSESIELLNGTEVEFVDSLKESGFKFNNPNATRACGCGKSFS